jgi:hypothetical protein
MVSLYLSDDSAFSLTAKLDRLFGRMRPDQLVFDPLSTLNAVSLCTNCHR